MHQIKTKLKTFYLFLSLLPLTILAQGQVFNDVEEYKSYVVNEANFEASKIIIVDADKVNQLMEYVTEHEMYTFYGIVSNYKVATAAQLSIKSCWGQFLDLCKRIDDEKSGITLQHVEDIPYLRDINFSPEKKTVVFIYSFKLGKRHVKHFIKPIMDEIAKDPTLDYIVLSFDIGNIKM